jgi:hypothetical protein
MRNDADLVAIVPSHSFEFGHTSSSGSKRSNLRTLCAQLSYLESRPPRSAFFGRVAEVGRRLGAE